MKAQPTILGFMGLIAFFAVGMAALRTNSELWAAAVFLLTVFTLCTAVLLAIHRRGAWAGFAVFGWAQFLICQPHAAPALGLTPLPLAMAYRIFFTLGNPAQFPTVAFRIPGYPAIMTDAQGEPFLAAVGGGSASVRGMVPVNSVRAGLCLTTILVGFVGAFVGGFIARRYAGGGDSHGDDHLS